MSFIADLHVHSRYSRATSPSMSPEGLSRWARIKGITVIGTGDFTHPLWIDELREKFEPIGNGLFRLKKKYDRGELEPPPGHDVPASCRGEVSFMLTAEVSSIYSKNGKVRKVHSIIFVPGFKEAGFINKRLSEIGNLSSDGRPILGLDAKRLLEIVLESSPMSMLVPAHAWTPHFSVFGASSGFDSLEECFEDLAPDIYAIETGLSSDPDMNRRLSALDRITLLSNSDAHSPSKLGREASVFETDVSYPSMLTAIKTGVGFGGTIEFFPEEGKYHYDGHRSCGISLSPSETKKNGYLCPACGRKLTIGVTHRVEELADRKTPPEIKPFRYIIPLEEIIAEAFGKGVNTKAVSGEYFKLIDSLGNEFGILLDVPIPDIAKASSERIAEAVSKVRGGDVRITPGYDGVYGRVSIFGQEKKAVKEKSPKKRKPARQKGLF